MNFNNKNFLVTGSTRGIGKAIASYLIKLGATVGIHGRNPKKVEEVCNELGPMQTVPIIADLSDPDNGPIIINNFTNVTKKIDGLVNNAGAGKALPFRGIQRISLYNTFNLNFFSALLASKEAYIYMRKEGGVIVNLTSISAHGPGKWMGADYAASKAALVSATQSLAFEAARFNIRVNAVSPGFVETEMTKSISEKMKSDLNIPMKRFAKPSEIAKPVAWLLSDDSAFITGQVLHVDGGLFTK